MLGQRISSRLIEIASASAMVALRSGLGPRHGYSADQFSNLLALPRPHLGLQSVYADAREHRRDQAERITRDRLCS